MRWCWKLGCKLPTLISLGFAPLMLLGLSYPIPVPGLPCSAPSSMFSSAIGQLQQRAAGQFVGPEQTAAFAVGLYLFLARLLPPLGRPTQSLKQNHPTEEAQRG